MNGDAGYRVYMAYVSVEDASSEERSRLQTSRTIRSIGYLVARSRGTHVASTYSVLSRTTRVCENGRGVSRKVGETQEKDRGIVVGKLRRENVASQPVALPS